MAWRRVPLILLCQALLSGGSNTTQSSFLSKGVQHCYQVLSQHSWCCLDTKLEPGVTLHTLSRPGTEWYCSEKLPIICPDSKWGGKGRRGDDQLWAPEGADCSTPRLLWIHGGSWIYSSPTRDGYASLGSKLAAKTGAVVMVIDYPLVPVSNYSTITSAALDALVWLASHGPLGRPCDGERPPLFLGGDSSGGGTALSMLLQANQQRDRWPALHGGIMYSPWTNLECDTPSYYYNAHSKSGNVYTGDLIFRKPPDTSKREYRENALQYVGNVTTMLQDPIASPFYAGPSELIGLPPLYFAVGTELITGDSVVPATKAAEVGVEVVLDIYEGMWHVFPMYQEGCGSNDSIYEAELALNRTGDFVRMLTQRASLAAVDAGLRNSRGISAEGQRGMPYMAQFYGDARQHGRSRPWVPVVRLSERLMARTPAPSTEAAPASGEEGGHSGFTVGAICGALAVLVARGLCLPLFSALRNRFSARGSSLLSGPSQLSPNALTLGARASHTADGSPNRNA